MSSGVLEEVAATLIGTGVVTGIGYFVAGPKAAAWCLGGGLVLAIVLRVARPKKPNPPPVAPSAPINNSATLTASPHIEVNIGDVDRKPPAPKAKEPSVRQDEIPSIASLKPKEVLLHEDAWGVWYEASTDLARARKAIVLPFKNLPKPPGEQTPRASSVTASLVFRNIDGSDERHINHGVWLGHYEYFATLNSGETQHLLVALKDTPFVTFENPNAYSRSGHFASGSGIHHPQMITVYTEGTVEIVLVGWRDITLFHGVFDYKLSVENMALTAKEQ
jgi:hypothetical protein